jgi:hypothetical protein
MRWISPERPQRQAETTPTTGFHLVNTISYLAEPFEVARKVGVRRTGSGLNPGTVGLGAAPEARALPC